MGNEILDLSGTFSIRNHGANCNEKGRCALQTSVCMLRNNGNVIQEHLCHQFHYWGTNNRLTETGIQILEFVINMIPKDTYLPELVV